MKDALKAVRKAYETALDNVSVGDDQIPFFDVVPEGGHSEYIYIESMRSEEISDKTEFTQEVNVTLVAVTDAQGTHGRIENSEELAEKVMDTIKNTITSTLDLTGDGFYMITNQMTGTSFLQAKEKNKSEALIKRRINFRHIVGQS